MEEKVINIEVVKAKQAELLRLIKEKNPRVRKTKCLDAALYYLANLFVGRYVVAPALWSIFDCVDIRIHQRVIQIAQLLDIDHRKLRDEIRKPIFNRYIGVCPMCKGTGKIKRVERLEKPDIVRDVDLEKAFMNGKVSVGQIIEDKLGNKYKCLKYGWQKLH